ncbi:sugar ABC transporter permease [Curtobacterium sp. MCLR17_007]|uniref:carbohydrate ABC transporter permease n=1 Tax=unclassified Curtobacterium TaxID=257496 RepID=UPI000DA7D5AD|nr:MULTISPECIES: sugar ABC transporter permease [unclassified Curtobacterium]WIB61746.1 sugar ABC transporter permease [Curtobacterium sp. MCLR17_007]
MTTTARPATAVRPATSTERRSRRAAKKHPWTPAEKRRLRVGIAFISPWIVGVLVFIAYPLVYSFVISLTRYSGMNAATFVGFGNYVAAFIDPLVHTAVENTLFYAVIAVPVGIVVAIVIALAMNQDVKEISWYRTALYIPSLIPTFALAFIFVVLVNPQTGIVNQVLKLVGVPATNLLGDPTTAKLVIVALAQMGAGNAALVFLAGMRGIPKTLYEAARVDGAGPVRQFFALTLPLISPAILFNLITGISNGLQVFTEAYVISSGTGGLGSPDNGTLFYMLYLYKNAFSYAQLGFASAMAVLLFLAGMVLSGLVYWLSRRFVNYDVSGE